MGRSSLLLVLILLAAAAPVGDPPLKEAQWIAPGRDTVALLTREPAECLKRTKDPVAAMSVEIGRAAFRNPLLLGGQAARVGLSCNSCHRSGRGNPDFVFPGLSGAPGTADVTSSLMSSRRGDGIDNPKVIPDLSGPRERLKVRNGVDKFVHGLIVEEFDGIAPPPRVVAGLVDYVSGLSSGNCPAVQEVPITLIARLEDVRRAVLAAEAALFVGDPATAKVMLSSARSMLGIVHERFADPALGDHREALQRASAALAAVPVGNSEEGHKRIKVWLSGQRRWAGDLLRAETRTLFNPERLKAEPASQ